MLQKVILDSNSHDAIAADIGFRSAVERCQRKANIAKHGVDLALAERFEFEAALVIEDADEAYGEQRFVAIGPIGNDLFVCVYTLNGEATEERILSLRRAEPKERRRFASEI